jgi:hypothetical protein
MCDCLQKRAREYEAGFQEMKWLTMAKPYEMSMVAMLQVRENFHEDRPQMIWQRDITIDYCPWCGAKMDSCREPLKV